MRTHVLVSLAALVGLAAATPTVAAQEVTAEVRTWSGESWRLMQPTLEIFYTIPPKGQAAGVSKSMESLESSVSGGGILEQTETRELEASAALQGHKRSEVVTLFREGAEMQIAFARIKSLQFFRQPVEKSPFPPYLAATHFRHFATAELVDGSRVEGDYVNLGTTVLRGMTAQGRVDIPWEDIENVRFESVGFEEPTGGEQRVALASAVAGPPTPAPRALPPVKQRITPFKEAPPVPQLTIEEERVARPSAVTEPPRPAPLKREVPPLKEAPQVPQPTIEEERVARPSAVTEPPVPIPKAPEPEKRDVVFDFNSLLLNDDAKVVLSAFGKWLKANPDAKVVMQGHCDERERGTNAYNLAIGELRIKAIRDHLVDAGIDGHRISTASDDEERSVVPPNDKSVWKCNRRVHLQVVQVEGPTR